MRRKVETRPDIPDWTVETEVKNRSFLLFYYAVSELPDHQKERANHIYNPVEVQPLTKVELEIQETRLNRKMAQSKRSSGDVEKTPHYVCTRPVQVAATVRSAASALSSLAGRAAPTQTLASGPKPARTVKTRRREHSDDDDAPKAKKARHMKQEDEQQRADTFQRLRSSRCAATNNSQVAMPSGPAQRLPSLSSRTSVTGRYLTEREKLLFVSIEESGMKSYSRAEKHSTVSVLRLTMLQEHQWLTTDIDLVIRIASDTNGAIATTIKEFADRHAIFVWRLEGPRDKTEMAKDLILQRYANENRHLFSLSWSRPS